VTGVVRGDAPGGHTTAMAPSKSLIKKLNYKPPKQLDINENFEEVEVIKYGAPAVTKPEIPFPTPEELRAWERARAKQKTLPNGQPAEGWAARLAAMEADGRLYRIGNKLYRRYDMLNCNT